MYSDPRKSTKIAARGDFRGSKLLTGANGTGRDDETSGGREVKVDVGLDARLRVNEFGRRRGMRVSAGAPTQ
jgi:hypothetical protein